MPRTVLPVLPTGHLRERQQPTVSGDGVVLRPWRTDDAGLVQRAFADPGIVHWHMRTIDDDDEAHGFADGWAGRWRDESDAGFVVTRDGGQGIGQVALREIMLAAGWAEVSYWILPEVRGCGLATAAVRALTGWALDDVGMHRLEILHAVGNVPSCRVADRAGYAHEGTLSRVLLHEDGWHDAHLHAAVADHWIPTMPSPAHE